HIGRQPHRPKCPGYLLERSHKTRRYPTYLLTLPSSALKMLPALQKNRRQRSLVPGLEKILLISVDQEAYCNLTRPFPLLCLKPFKNISGFFLTAKGCGVHELPAFRISIRLIRHLCGV